MKTNNSYFSRILVILIAVMMVFTMMPSMAFAAEGGGTPAAGEAPTVTIHITATDSLNNITYFNEEMTVPAGYAKKVDASITYGTDVGENDVTFLDALAYLHYLKYGEAYTTEPQKYLKMSGAMISVAFENTKAGNSVCSVNGEAPQSGMTMLAVNEAKLAQNDKIEYHIMADLESYTGDYLTALVKADSQISEATVISGEASGIFLKGGSAYSKLYPDYYEQYSETNLLNTNDAIVVSKYENHSFGAAIDGLTIGSDGQLCVADSVASGTYELCINGVYEDDKETVYSLIPSYLKLTVIKPNVSITVPSDAEVTIGAVSNYYVFTEDEAVKTKINEVDNTTTYYYDLSKNSSGSLYRVSGETYLTNIGYLQKQTGLMNVTLTEAELKPEGKTKTTIDRSFSSNNGYNVADIFLNINAQGYLKLRNVNDRYQIVNLRNWQPVTDLTNNKYLEPDYHYTVVNENGKNDDTVVRIDENGVITAVGNGTAIVLVTYDAMNANYGANNKQSGFYGAIWPENTGVFVISVGAGESEISTGMTINKGKNNSKEKISGDAIDAEHDVIYYIGETGEYNFTPQSSDVTVAVANPSISETMSFTGFVNVQKNGDGSYTVPLKEGRNIIKVSKDNRFEYQVITAKKVTVEVNSGEAVKKGDALKIRFSTLYTPANKLAGIYNPFMPATLAVYESVDGYEGKIAGSKAGNYNIANNTSAQTVANFVTLNGTAWKTGEELKVPENFEKDTYTLSGGTVFEGYFGSPIGAHRGITWTEGKPVNMNAVAVKAYLGQLPDIEIPIVATTAELSKISLTTTDVKTTYYEGDAFDTTNLVVTAEYADNATQTATNYTVSPSVLTKDTTKVIITYRGKTATIPVSVKEVQLTGIEVETQPTKTTYTVGDVFNPNGIKIKATYDNKSTADVTSKVTYSNTVFNTAGDEIAVKVTYTEKGITKETILNVKVNPAQGGTTPTDTISVTFTLLGDSHHGEPTKATGTHTLKANNLETWIKKTTYTLPKGSNVVYLLEKALGTAGIPYTNPSGNYVDTIRGLAAFDNGTNSGWMYTYNGKHGLLGVAEQRLNDGDVIVFHYTDDYTKEEGSEQWNGGSDGTVEEVKSVTSDTKAGTTTAPTEVKVTEKTNADGTKTKVADVKVSADNQKEILKQAKEKKSNEIILVVSKDAVKDAAKADVTLDKSFIDSIVKDTNAKLTIKTPFGDKTYTQEELKAMSAAATGSTISIAVEKAAEEPTDDAAAKVEKAKSIVKDMKLTARSSKTAKKNVKAVLKNDAKSKAAIKELKDLGFTVKYRFYRSTKKSASYKPAITKKVASYTNTSGKKGTKYFYKVQVRVYDENGKLVAKTALKQCKYASRTWTK